MTELLVEGFSIMLIGMGTVLLFLLILILFMNVMAVTIAYLNKLFPEIIPESGIKTKKVTTNNNDEIALAIAVAVTSDKQ